MPERPLSPIHNAASTPTAGVIDIAASVGNWYVEANAQRLRLNVQFAVLPPDELASVTVDVLRRFHAMDDPLDVTHTVSFALVVLADAGRLQACALLLGWLSGRPTFHADPLGRLAEVSSTVEESLSEKTQPLIDAGRTMSLDDIVDLASTELDATKDSTACGHRDSSLSGCYVGSVGARST